MHGLGKFGGVMLLICYNLCDCHLTMFITAVPVCKRVTLLGIRLLELCIISDYSNTVGLDQSRAYDKGVVKGGVWLVILGSQ
uniref:Uncharacterized protein n=1 Tax=Hordeum vulgare subsp. vulgare TaxID=112509 RepID=A0A8I6WTT4_HORVV